jgi:hypothetical protein
MEGEHVLIEQGAKCDLKALRHVRWKVGHLQRRVPGVERPNRCQVIAGSLPKHAFAWSRSAIG